MAIEISKLISLDTAIDMLKKFEWEYLYKQYGEEHFYIKDTPYSFYVLESINKGYNVNIGMRTDYSEIDIEVTCSNIQDILSYIHYENCWKMVDTL